MGNRRLTRSDKKVDVKPTISEILKTRLYRFSEFCEEPVKDVAERLCNDGAVSPIIINEMKMWFRRDYRFKNTITMGNLDRPRLKVSTSIDRGKVTIKFKQKDFDQLTTLAYSMDLTPTTTAAILIRMTLGSKPFMQWYIGTYLSDFDSTEIREVYKILKL